MRTVLFVCVENSFRSQMAEAYFNLMAPKGWRALSAGVKPGDRVHPNALRLMEEEGVDIGGKKPRLLTRGLQEGADLVIVVCGEECPLVYAKRVEKWNMPDPAKMSLEDARKVRDAIKARVVELLRRLEE